MAGVLRLCPAVALLVVAFAAGSEPTGSTKSLQAQVEKECFQKVGMTPEEISTIEDVMKRLDEARDTTKKKEELDFLDYVDLYARTPEISKGIRAKWEAFMTCMADEAAARGQEV
ncbi:uncharacterized protein [Dermacentor andersoni]|uniref:uncharacterized protein n=1 Tax=Dermacentor andersoni TaxID=34620 RepID=UPI00241687D3|nr:uncharacterized protein LOC129382002 [Dermacentor andersoni]